MSVHHSQTVDSPVIVALDYHDRRACEALVEQLKPRQCRLKIGSEMFTLFGPSLVEQLQHRGFEVFLDLKFHDIPATVAKAVQSAADLGVWMVNVHAGGGSRMLSAAAQALQTYDRKPLLIAVTLLTSMDQAGLRELGIECPVEQQVLRLAGLVNRCGLDGVVCSAREARLLKAEFGPEFKLITPGIRPRGATANDQVRTMTPLEALAAGSDYLVIGRPITAAPDPAQACSEIIAGLAQAQQGG